MQSALHRADSRYTSCKEELAVLRSAIEQLNKYVEDGCEIHQETLTEEKKTLMEQRQKILMTQKDIYARLTANGKAKKDIAKKSEETEQLEHRYAWMRTLSDTANGTLTGKQRIALETHIQTTYFERILQRANLRLMKMSGGQYDLKRDSNEENKQGKSGLDLNIIDYVNGTERSVNTLSGGESFLASLALALGLSDEVQMSAGIKLDTLFVDEGFGSLDSAALNKAYHTLMGLTEGNRLVGIISHVADLKEWIDYQIVVKKDKTGGSQASIRLP
jgi:exonuclease SbcC